MKVMKSYHTAIPAYDGAHGGLLAVLTDGGAGREGGDLAVYIGAINLDPDAPDYEVQRKLAADWIAGRGIKLSYAKALAYYPGLIESEYRA